MVLRGFARFAVGGGGVVIYDFTNIERVLKFTDHINK